MSRPGTRGSRTLDARSLGTRSIAFFLPIIIAAAFLNVGQTECSCNCPAAPSVTAFQSGSHVSVTASLPVSAPQSSSVLFYRDGVVIGQIDGVPAGGQSTFHDSLGLETGTTYVYYATYFAPPSGKESDPSNTAAVTYLPPAPLMLFATEDITIPCDRPWFVNQEFWGGSVPQGSTLNLYRDGLLVGTGIADTFHTLTTYKGAVTTEVGRQTYPGQVYEYRFTYMDSNGVESVPSSPRNVIAPHCSFADFPALEDDGNLDIGVYLVRYQDFPDPGPTFTVAQAYDAIFGSDPLSVSSFVDFVTDSVVSASGQVYGDPQTGEWVVYPFDQLPPCSGSECEALAREVLDFLADEIGIPTHLHESHMVVLEGWNGITGVGITGVNYGDVSLYEGGQFRSRGPARAVLHENVGHGVYRLWHVGEWDCSAIVDSDAGPSLRNLTDGGCLVTGASHDVMSSSSSSYFMNGLSLARMAAYGPDDMLEVSESGSYVLAHWGSTSGYKRIDIDLGNNVRYMVDYRVSPYYVGPYPVRVYLQPNGDASAATYNEADVFLVKEMYRNGPQFVDAYRNITIDVGFGPEHPDNVTLFVTVP